MRHNRSITCTDESAMQRLGAQLFATLSHVTLARSLVVTLRGELGAGKSVLARSMIHAAGFSGRVKSPTYTLIETYNIDDPTGRISRIAHLDLYRLTDPEELHYLGFDDVLDSHDVVLIEWPDKAGDLLPGVLLQIDIEYVLPAGREVSLTSGHITLDHL